MRRLRAVVLAALAAAAWVALLVMGDVEMVGAGTAAFVEFAGGVAVATWMVGAAALSGSGRNWKRLLA